MKNAAGSVHILGNNKNGSTLTEGSRVFFKTALKSPEMSIIIKRLTSQFQNVFNRQF